MYVVITMTAPTALSLAADAAALDGGLVVLQYLSNETLLYHTLFHCRLQLLRRNSSMLLPANTLI